MAGLLLLLSCLVFTVAKFSVKNIMEKDAWVQSKGNQNQNDHLEMMD